jgi:hypothetical protein
MPVTYRIHLDLNAVYVRYSGVALLQDSFVAVGTYLQDPDFRPNQKQFVDLSAVTDFERDYAKLFALQAKKAEAFFRGIESLVVYLAPTEVTRAMANLIAQSWKDVGAVVPVVVTTIEDAQTVLGFDAESFEALMARRVE